MKTKNTLPFNNVFLSVLTLTFCIFNGSIQAQASENLNQTRTGLQLDEKTADNLGKKLCAQDNNYPQQNFSFHFTSNADVIATGLNMTNNDIKLIDNEIPFRLENVFNCRLQKTENDSTPSNTAETIHIAAGDQWISESYQCAKNANNFHTLTVNFQKQSEGKSLTLTCEINKKTFKYNDFINEAQQQQSLLFTILAK